jgi:hypothetical protein
MGFPTELPGYAQHLSELHGGFDRGSVGAERKEAPKRYEYGAELGDIAGDDVGGGLGRERMSERGTTGLQTPVQAAFSAYNAKQVRDARSSKN